MLGLCQDILPQNTSGSQGLRGTAHGMAMKQVCPTDPSYAPQGASKPASQGGFSALLAGNVCESISFTFGVVAPKVRPAHGIGT